MNMPKIAIVMGILLDLVGVAGFVHAVSQGTTAPTALIPAVLGAIFIVLGAVSLAKPDLRKHLMHALAMLALIGVLGGAGRLMASWNKPATVAHASQAAMAVICAITLFFCIKSFRDARKARELAV